MNATLQPFIETIKLKFPKAVEAQLKDLLLKSAEEEHRKVLSEQTLRGGVEPDWDAYANEPTNKNLDSVRLPGPIVYNYRYYAEVIQKALSLLRLRSPIDSGLYQKSHTLYINGVERDPEAPGSIGIDDEIMIVNTVPYARKIEVGKTKAGQPFVVQVPNRIYQRTAEELASKYSKLTTIKYTFVPLPGANTVSPGMRFKRNRKVGPRGGRELSYPAIKIGSKY